MNVSLLRLQWGKPTATKDYFGVALIFAFKNETARTEIETEAEHDNFWSLHWTKPRR